MSNPTDETNWILGLSLDEDVSWGVIRVGADNRFASRFPDQHGRLLSAWEVNQKIGLEALLRSRLKTISLRPELKKIFREVKAIGVSSMGLVDRKNVRLTSIARKRWVADETGAKDCVADFNRVFDTELFPSVRKTNGSRHDDTERRINVHNDATARCLLEYYQQPDYDRAETLFHLLISEGVNGGLVVRGWPFQTELHPEIGHIWPRLHEGDYHFDHDKSGCPVHKECFEGLASGARIRKSWGNKPLSEMGADFPSDEQHPWRRIAFYIAQLCMTAALAVSPERITIGGTVVFPELIPMIQREFDLFNTGRIRRPDGMAKRYLTYDAMMRDDFIQIARIRQNEDLWGALELARLALQPLAPIYPLLGARSRRRVKA